MQFLLPSPHLN